MQTKRHFQTQYRPGSIVAEVSATGTVKPSARRMSVEGMTQTALSETLNCVWFGADDQLHSELVPARRLALSGEQFEPLDISVGDEVRLNAAGPVMSVISIDSAHALCEWDGPQDMVRRRSFPTDCLIRSLFKPV